MGMEFLSFHDEFIADLAAHEKNDHFAFIDIIQDTQIARAQFELGEQIGAQPLDGLRGRGRLVPEP
jgi:hypothetical protein